MMPEQTGQFCVYDRIGDRQFMRCSLFFYKFASRKQMNIFVTIFIALLSFIFDGDLSNYVCDSGIRHNDTVVQCSDKDATDQKADFNDVAILPVRTASYSGDGNGFAPLFRSTNSGRRVQPNTKITSRFIKFGKVLDRTYFCTFQTVLLQFQSGMRSSSRYIYSICQLLL